MSPRDPRHARRGCSWTATPLRFAQEARSWARASTFFTRTASSRPRHPRFSRCRTWSARRHCRRPEVLPRSPPCVENWSTSPGQAPRCGLAPSLSRSARKGLRTVSVSPQRSSSSCGLGGWLAAAVCRHHSLYGKSGETIYFLPPDREGRLAMDLAATSAEYSSTPACCRASLSDPRLRQRALQLIAEELLGTWRDGSEASWEPAPSCSARHRTCTSGLYVALCVGYHEVIASESSAGPHGPAWFADPANPELLRSAPQVVGALGRLLYTSTRKRGPAERNVRPCPRTTPRRPARPTSTGVPSTYDQCR